MSTDLTGATALVTGATSGIGKATALLLVERGAHVIVSGRDADRGAAVVDTITQGGGQSNFFPDGPDAPQLAPRERVRTGRVSNGLDIPNTPMTRLQEAAALGQAEPGLAVVSTRRSDRAIQSTPAGPTKDARDSR